MGQTRKSYPFPQIERKWQERWVRHDVFRAWNPGDEIPSGHPFARRHGLSGRVEADRLPPKYYILDMFPYPSGSGLHVGHPEGYTATDILARYHRALGYNVLHPMGWDAFGLPAEQYAIRTGQQPRETTGANVANFRRQIRSLGFSYDWQREINTTDPGYFRWTQWIFLAIYNSWYNPGTGRAEPIETCLPGDPEATEEEIDDWRRERRLAYVDDLPVNWCPQLGTVLSNEEVVEGRSEVGGFPVERRPMRQWVLRITAYADRLLQDLDGLEWSDSLKGMQRNWIGRSEGAEVEFRLSAGEGTARVYTTRPDTLFGATYLVLSPEHPLIGKAVRPECRGEVEEYCRMAAAKSDLERTDLARDKTGVFTGAFAINPANGEEIPVWVSDYVLAGVGTGAIMAVPAHDGRDLEFARKFNLPIKKVVQAPGKEESVGYTGDGIAVNSGFLDELPSARARSRIADWLEERGRGRRAVQYKLRDWLFSRQRYWGEPFPIVWRGDRHFGLDPGSLPLLPPDLDDFKPTEEGDPPLARAAEWCRAGDGARRETNTMPQWAGSCWYYLRFLDPDNAERFCDPEAERYWMGGPGGDRPGVDLYVGGTEHAVLHLLYARFWHKVLHDLGHLSTPEPFRRLVNQGLILGEDGQKMSKSRGNVVNPDSVLEKYGADAFRLYEMFMGPLEMVKPWNTQGVEGVYRFLGRVWRLFVDPESDREFQQESALGRADPQDLLDSIRISPRVADVPPGEDQSRALHACIRKVTEDLDAMHFNTAISALMVFVNEASGWERAPRSLLLPFLRLLEPFAPHLAEELHARMTGGKGDLLAWQEWPRHDPELLASRTVEIPVQINGRIRARIEVDAKAAPEAVEKLAVGHERIVEALGERTVRKAIVVPGKLVNLVVR